MSTPDYQQLLTQMTQQYQSLAGFSPDDASDIGIRFKALATQLEALWQRLGELAQQAFPESAMGESLDRHAAQRGLMRKSGTTAQGQLRFSRQSPAAYDIPIPKGRLCQGKGEAAQRVQTTADAVLPAGALYVDVPAACVEAGRGGNLAPGMVELMINPPQGISAVTNPQPFAGGWDSETDESLRTRLMDSYRFVSNGANAAYYRQAVMSADGVATVAVLPCRRGAGTVDVVVSGVDANPTGQQISALQQHLSKVREIGVDVRVLPAQEVSQTLAVELSPAEGVTFEALVQPAQKALWAMLRTQRIGQPLYVALLVRQLLALEGVGNCRVITPQGDRHILADQILRPGELTVTEMAVAP